MIDTVVDAGFVLYDLHKLRTDPRTFGWNLLALHLDILGAALPFVTGIGLAAHIGGKADDVVDLYRAVGVREYESIMKNKAFLPGGPSLEGRQIASPSMRR